MGIQDYSIRTELTYVDWVLGRSAFMDHDVEQFTHDRQRRLRLPARVSRNPADCPLRGLRNAAISLIWQAGTAAGVFDGQPEKLPKNENR